MSIQNLTGKNGTAKQKLSEEWKDKESYLKTELDNTIMSCDSDDKKDIEKAYVIRNGKRPRSKFEYLAKAYGIQYPAKIRHIPVLKSMFDAILAIDQSSPLDYKVTCKDVESINNNQEELKNSLVKKFVGLAKERLDEAAEFFEGNKRGEMPAPPEKMDDSALKRIILDLHTSFRSSVEISSQDLLETMIQRLELEVLISIMMEDLIASGSEYYQCKALEKGKKPLVRVVNPLNVYYRKDINKKFLKDHNRVLIKETVNLQDLLMNYGHLIKPKDIKRLLESCDITLDSGNKFWSMRDMSYTGLKKNLDQLSYEQLYDTEMTLYYGEWIANTEIEYEDSFLEGMEMKSEKKRKYRKDRYEGFRINEDIYFGLKKSDFIYRPSDDPGNCFLTINGASYNDRNGEPYSLVLSTEDIADKIDILHYIWESMVAMSGTKAAMINYKAIPAWLSTDPKDRVQKWLGMGKMGALLVDPSQPGAKDFNNYGSIDMSIDQGIGVITEMIRYLEEVASKITGVSAQMLGAIAPDALKGTTQMALNQSSMVLMPFFFTHQSVIKHMLTDILNASRLVYSEGFTGSYMLGDLQQRVFSIDSDKFWLADFDVWLSNSGDEMKSIEELKALSIELVKANQIDAVAAVDMNTIKSLTKIKEGLKKSIKLKEENEVDKLNQQLVQIQGEMQKVMAELEKVDQAKMQMDQRSMALDQKRLEVDHLLKNRELDIKEEIENKKIDLEKKRVELESLELTYSDKAREIKNQ